MIYVAVVDDDASIRSALKRGLELHGIESFGFESGSDFLNSLQTRVPDCLIVDLEMPRMSGFDLQRQLIDLRYSIPLIAITGNRDPIAVRRVVHEGATACLFKPIDLNMMIQTIQSSTV